MKKIVIFFLVIIIVLNIFSYQKVFAKNEKKIFFAPSDTALKHKSPMGALLRSVAFPGWGQFYNEKYLKAIVVFGFETSYIILALDEWIKTNKSKKDFKNAKNFVDSLYQFDLYQYHRDTRNLYLWVVSGIIFISMFDAYVDAHLYNFDKVKMKDLEVGLDLQPYDKRISLLINYNF